MIILLKSQLYKTCCPDCPSCKDNAFQMGEATWAAIKTFLVQVRLRTEVPITPSSTRSGFELMTSRSWQYISCYRDACCNYSAISDFLYIYTQCTIRRISDDMLIQILHRWAEYIPSPWSWSDLTIPGVCKSYGTVIDQLINCKALS